VASLSQGRTAAAQCGLFTHKSVPVIFEPPCNLQMYCKWIFCLTEKFHAMTPILDITLSCVRVLGCIVDKSVTLG